jgi:hypothetical protein
MTIEQFTGFHFLRKFFRQKPRSLVVDSTHQAAVWVATGIAGFELRDVAGEGGGDVRESSVNATGQELHADNCAECDQGHDESVLDQILTFFPSHQRLESEIHLDHEIIHCCEFSISWVGVPVIDW